MWSVRHREWSPQPMARELRPAPPSVSVLAYPADPSSPPHGFPSGSSSVSALAIHSFSAFRTRSTAELVGSDPLTPCDGHSPSSPAKPHAVAARASEAPLVGFGDPLRGACQGNWGWNEAIMFSLFVWSHIAPRCLKICYYRTRTFWGFLDSPGQTSAASKLVPDGSYCSTSVKLPSCLTL